jgi:hypothetical protein
MLKQLSAATLTATLLIGCATVTVRPEGGPRVIDRPDYQVTKSYFFWGLSGEHTIDVAAVCKEKGVEQFQSQLTSMNVFLGVITLGIYTPKTAKVWCKLGGDSK